MTNKPDNSNFANELPLTFKPTPVAHLPERKGTGVPKDIDATASALKEKFGANVVRAVEKAHKGDPYLVVDANQIVDVLRFLRDDERYLCTMLSVISSTDFLPVEASAPGAETAVAARKGYVDVTYVVFSFQHKHQIMVKVHLDRANARVSTVCDVYRAANWYERECYDMIGVVFEGHPHHKRILLPDDWVGHPLRRDYVFPEEYNGMKVPL